MIEVKFNEEFNCWTLWVEGECYLEYSYKSKKDAIYWKELIEAFAKL
jgi:hypothetical protein